MDMDLDAYKYTIQVLTYLDGLPDNTWPEPDPKDPLSLVDKVTQCVHTKSLSLC